VHRDPREPGAERRPSRELIEVRERPDVGLLNHVLRLGVVPEDRADGAIDALVVAAHEDLEQRGIAGAHPLHHLLVGELALAGTATLCSTIHARPHRYGVAHAKKVPGNLGTVNRLYSMGGEP